MSATDSLERLPPHTVESRLRPSSFLAARDQSFGIDFLGLLRFIVVVFTVGGQAVEDGVCRIRHQAPSQSMALSNIANIVAAITGVGKRHLAACRLQPTQPDTHAENVHLSARVIDVVLTAYGSNRRLPAGCQRSRRKRHAGRDLRAAARSGWQRRTPAGSSVCPSRACRP